MTNHFRIRTRILLYLYRKYYTDGSDQYYDNTEGTIAVDSGVDTSACTPIDTAGDLAYLVNKGLVTYPVSQPSGKIDTTQIQITATGIDYVEKVTKYDSANLPLKYDFDIMSFSQYSVDTTVFK